MEAKLIDSQKLKSGGWLILVELTKFNWRKFRFVTKQIQFFTNDEDLNYGTSWFTVDTAHHVDSKLHIVLCEATYEFYSNLSAETNRMSRLNSFNMNTTSDGNKRVAINNE